MARQVSTFLMFEGKAEEAMTFYVSLFDDATVADVVRYGPDGPGPEGSVMHASFTLKGQSGTLGPSTFSRQWRLNRAPHMLAGEQQRR